jgi:hypothetical protein
MAQRTDKFRPSVIDPSKFVFVSQHYLGPISDDFAESGICEEMAEEQRNLEEHQAAHPGFVVAGHKWPGQCDCCGARYMWGSTFYTAEANTYISIGCTCASKLRLGDPAAMKSFREQVNTWKIHNERVAAARAFVATHNLGAALALYLSNAKADPSLSEYDRFPHNTLVDMMGKLVRWGTISEKQIAFAHKLLAQIADQPRKLAEREAKDAARQNVPDSAKRIRVEGVVISAKYHEGGYTDTFFAPECIKIVVEHADGWRVWGTAPRELYYVEPNYTAGEKNNYRNTSPEAADWLKGKRVAFDARVTVSDKDSKFGFFKRPTKPELLDAAPVAA